MQAEYQVKCMRRTIEANWNKILKKLCIVPSSKQDTLEEKVACVLQSLKDDQYIQEAKHRLIAVVTETVGHKYHREILELIESVELRVRVHDPLECCYWVHTLTYDYHNLFKKHMSTKFRAVSEVNTLVCSLHVAATHLIVWRWMDVF